MLVTNSQLHINNNYKKYNRKSFGNVQKEAEFLSNKQKLAILGASTAGMAAGLVLCGKFQGLNIFKKEQFKKLKFDGIEIFTLAACSMIGGLLAGIAVDKTNKDDKLSEAMQQMVGNVIFPIAFVAGGNYIYEKIKPHIKFPKTNNRVLNAVIHSMPQILVTAAGLWGGLVVGNKFANSINNKIFKKNEAWEMEISDFASQVDDTLLGASLISKKLSATQSSASVASGTSFISSAATKLIPPALVIPGYIAGTAQD